MGENPNSKEREASSYIVFLVLCLLVTLLALDAYLIVRLF
jgi:hypothetical protein